MNPDNAPSAADGGTVGPVAYRAQQIPGAVVIFAEGFNPTPGYTNVFEQSPIEIYPPQFILRSVPPGGFTTQVLTPFSIWVMFGASRPVKTVTVVDGAGSHKIDVEQTPDLKAAETTETWLHGHVMAKARAGGEQPTTMATGEESGGGPTTMATGEEHSLAAFTARSVFDYTLAKKSAFGGLTFTTLMYGEESGGSHWKTLMHGEEGPIFTTLMLGEEHPHWKTLKIGEEGPTTLMLGEEGPGGGYGGGNPFGDF